MNKIYKLVWSKTRNMYIAVCEFAKSHTKSPKTGILNRVLVIGTMTVLLGFSNFTKPVFAAVGDHGGTVDNYTTSPLTLTYDTSTGTLHLLNGQSSDGDYTNDAWVIIGDVSGSGSGTITYTAGNGISISSDNKISVKAGTNVTVNSSGVSVTGNGSVASGNTGLISGGTLYSELRPSDNGNYVMMNCNCPQFLASFPEVFL